MYNNYFGSPQLTIGFIQYALKMDDYELSVEVQELCQIGYYNALAGIPRHDFNKNNIARIRELENLFSEGYDHEPLMDMFLDAYGKGVSDRNKLITNSNLRISSLLPGSVSHSVGNIPLDDLANYLNCFQE